MTYSDPKAMFGGSPYRPTGAADADTTRPPTRALQLPLRTLPSLTALQAFERSAIQLSFRRAARDLALTPSAISHQIRNLEDHFGVRLFARDGRTVRLTREGEGYLESVTRALSMLEEASRGLMHQGRGGRREIRVSALPFVMSTVMIPSLATFEKRHPDLTLRFQATHDYADFERNDVDIAIRYGGERSMGLKMEPILEVHGLPVCAPRLSNGKILAAHELADHVLIHVTQHPEAWRLWFEDSGRPDIKPRGEIWFDSLPAAFDAAEHGLGVALAPYPLINGRRGFGDTLVAAGALTTQSETFHMVVRPQQADARWLISFRTWLMESLEQAIKPRPNASAVDMPG